MTAHPFTPEDGAALDEGGLMSAALWHASRGWHVFPCDPASKKPLTTHGLKDATADAAVIRKWWQRWPRAMIGVRTGPESGFWALDLDTDGEWEGIDGIAAFAELQGDREPIGDTVQSTTPRGGAHHLFRWADGVRNSASKIAPGVDIRGQGGYIVVPPSARADGARYRWENPPGMFEPLDAPQWLLDLVRADPEQSGPKPNGKDGPWPNGKADFFEGARRSAYVDAALRNECAAVAREVRTRRNDRLNKAAFSLGQLLHSGAIDEGTIYRALEAAANACGLVQDDGLHAVIATITSGIRAGLSKPRDIPEPDSDRDGECSYAIGISLDDFHAYMPMHSYIFAPTREMWPAGSINQRIPPVSAKEDSKPITASVWLDQHKPVEQMTWAPGLPMLIKDRLISDGGWIERNGVTCFNLYRPPTFKPGNAANAVKWVEHVRKVYPDDAEHIIKWLAHRVQRPQEKINHAIVLGGRQGTGKDSLLEPVKHAVGPWNFIEVSPQHMLGRFNGFLKSVILRVSEARDLGDVDRFAFYDHMKSYTAAPPDVLRVDEKFLREYAVLNVCGVIITSNHKADGIYLPADDRRHYVAWSELSKEDFADGYWNDLWSWYAEGGNQHVAAYLAQLDLRGFDPKAPPPKTAAFWDIVDAGRAPEDAELADVLDRIGNPAAVTLDRIKREASPLAEPERGSFAEWIRDRKNRRVVPHRLEQCGYVPVRNDDAQDGLWKINGRRQVVYGRATLMPHERVRAARELRR